MQLRTFTAADSAGNVLAGAVVQVFAPGDSTTPLSVTDTNGNSVTTLETNARGAVSFSVSTGKYDVHFTAKGETIVRPSEQFFDVADVPDAASTVLNGTVDPTPADGRNGDFYINTATVQIFGPKASDVWPAGTSLIGPAGADGVNGINGVDGVNGVDGQDGADGTSVTILGTLASSGDLPASGNSGDAYLINGNLHVWDGTQWEDVGTIQGPAGNDGINGTNGVNGTNGIDGADGQDGATVLSGQGVPSNSLGSNGDHYIDLNNLNIHSPKANGIWPAGVSLQGAPGADGQDGQDGADGADGEPGTADYANRAAAEASTNPSNVRSIGVLAPNGRYLKFVEAETGETNVALTDAGGRSWVPELTNVTPQHWAENTTPGTTNMHSAIMSALRFLSYGAFPADPDTTFAMHAMVRQTVYRTLNFLGERMAVSQPVIIGDLDTNLDGTFNGIGSGLMHAVQIINGRIEAASDFNTSALATFNNAQEGVITSVPDCVVFVGSYDQYDRKTTMRQKALVSEISFDRFEINANFLTNGIFWQNTRNCGMYNCEVNNIGQNKTGILTSVADADVSPRNVNGTLNVTGINTQNTELVLSNIVVRARDRRSGTSFPGGVGDPVWNATGFGIFCADVFLEQCRATATATSAIFDGFSNGQVDHCHFWGGPVIVGANCAHLKSSNIYYDFSNWRFYSFNHNCTNHSLLAGTSNLVMVASTQNETGEGFVMSGLIATNGSNIVFETDTTADANASWVPLASRLHRFSAMYLSEATVPFREFMPNSHYVDSDHKTVFFGNIDFNGTVGGSGIISTGTSADGDWIQFYDGTLIITHQLDLTYQDGEHVRETWTYPTAAPAFIGNNPIVSGMIDRNSVVGNATPNPDQIGMLCTASEGLLSTFLEVYRINGQTDFAGPDTITVRVQATGRWA